MTALLETNPVAVNAFWQSTSSAKGPNNRSAEAAEANPIAAAIYRYNPPAQASRRRLRSRKITQLTCMSLARVRSAIMMFLELKDRFTTCSVSKHMMAATPAQDVQLLKFRVCVTNFCFSKEAARLFRPLQMPDKYELVMGAYRSIDKLPPLGDSRSWGPAVLSVSVAVSGLAQEQQDTLRSQIRGSCKTTKAKKEFDQVVAWIQNIGDHV